MATVRRSAAWEAPVLDSCAAASPLCTDVVVSPEQVAAVADWMCFEEFPPLGGGRTDPALARPDRAVQIGLAGFLGAINFAYTDFDTRIRWSVVHEGRHLVDADALRLRLEQAVGAGLPVLTGEWMATVTEERFLEIAHGPRRIPMVAERVAVLNAMGRVLLDRYDGSFEAFVDDCPDLAYDNGGGLLERLIDEIPNFDDRAEIRGHQVRIDKLAQLLVWTLHRLGLKTINDLDTLTVFADYIVPAALRRMKVLRYSPELAAAVDGGGLIPAGSTWEVELRVQTVCACALLTDAINERRSGVAPAVVNAQVDYRFWSAFHSLMRPHHLTVTTRY